jgi:hypothetical protein
MTQIEVKKPSIDEKETVKKETVKEISNLKKEVEKKGKVNLMPDREVGKKKTVKLLPDREVGKKETVKILPDQKEENNESITKKDVEAFIREAKEGMAETMGRAALEAAEY